VAYKHYDATKSKFEKAEEHVVASFRQKQGIKELVIESGSVKHTPYDTDEHRHFNHTEFIRDGRSFGSILLTPKRNGGDENQICNRICYNSKLLNTALGIDSKKTIAPKPSLLMSAIRSFLMETTRARWRKLAYESPVIPNEVDSDNSEFSDTDSAASSSSSDVAAARSPAKPIPMPIPSGGGPSSAASSAEEDPVIIPDHDDSDIPHEDPSAPQPHNDADDLKARFTQLTHDVHFALTFHDFNIHTLHPMIEDLYHISQKLHTMSGV
jgi:hypothetical protein